MNVLLQDMSWEESQAFQTQCKGVAIVPVGSVEQHGYHLPLGTDTYVAQMLAEDAANESPVLVTPPIWFGWSPHHMALAGTVTIRAEILIEYLYDVMVSLKDHGFNKIILINGHRVVNIPWMQITAERAQRLLGIRVKIFDPAYMSKSLIEELEFGPVGHSEEIETSHMLYKHPNLVHMEKAKDNPITAHLLYSVDPRYTGDTLCYVPSTLQDMKTSVDVAGGTTGEPSKSSSGKGQIYHKHLVNNLVQVIKQLKG